MIDQPRRKGRQQKLGLFTRSWFKVRERRGEERRGEESWRQIVQVLPYTCTNQLNYLDHSCRAAGRDHCTVTLPYSYTSKVFAN